MRAFGRVLAAAIGLGGVFALGCFVYAVADLRQFEWLPLWGFLGLRGTLFLVAFVAGLALVTAVSLRHALGRSSKTAPRRRWIVVALLAWGAATLWLAEWTFMERPLTVMISEHFIEPRDEQLAIQAARERATSDGSLAALASVLPDADPDRVSIMLARIRANRPSVFADVSIGKVIVEYATRYDVSPVLLLHWAYIDSWYGEAPAGRMPFFAEVNGEMFRDLVQAHLPWWFIESPLRRELIEGPWFGVFPGGTLGVKLRYALQKATYDIAVSPYMNSVMSDTLLVLHVYKNEFPELFGPKAPEDPLARAFLKIEPDALLQPYHEPYVHRPRDEAYYDRHRDDLIDFARAAVYRLAGDFAFATKVQALVARYYSGQYAARLGADRWVRVPERQKTALLAMLRDVYVPDIGKVSYNLYMVPEFNTTPINFLAAEADREFDSLLRTDKTWVPADGSKFWGATGLMLRSLGAAWGAATGTPLAGIVPADTLPDAMRVLAREKNE